MKKEILFIAIAFFLILQVPKVSASLSVSWSVLDEQVRPGGETTILLTFSNPTTLSISNIKVNVYAENYLTPYPTYFEIGSLSPGFSQQTSIKVKVSWNAPSSISFVTLRIEYYEMSGRKELSLNIPINIKALPILQIEDVNFSKERIEPGNSLLLSFYLSNKGDGSAKDITIKLNQSLITSETGEIFIPEIKPKERVLIQIPITVNPSLQIGIYPLPLIITYWDETKSQYYSEIKTISLKLSGKYTFIVTLEDQDILTPASEGLIEIKIANAGTQEAKFLYLTFSYDFPIKELTPSIVYVGNLDPDDYDSEVLKLKISENVLPGYYPLNMTLNFEDVYGNEYSETYILNLRISEKVEKLNIFYFSIVLICLIAFLLILKFYKRTKRKK